MHPLAAIFLGLLLILTGLTGLAWLFASTVNAEGRWAALDYHFDCWEREHV